MKKAFFLLAMFSLSVANGNMLVVESLNADGIMVKVDIFKTIDTLKKMCNQTEDEYVVTLNRPHSGLLYAEAVNGMIDAPVIAYSNTVKKGIFQAVGDSIAENPWPWTIGVAGGLFGLYKIGEHNNWGKSSEDDNVPAIPSIQTGDNSPVYVILNDNNSHTDYSSTITKE